MIIDNKLLEEDVFKLFMQEYDFSKNRDSLYGFSNCPEFNAKKISYYEYCKLAHGDILYLDQNLKKYKQCCGK